MTILDQETLTWYSADAPPEADTTVLVYAPEGDEPVWFGYFDGEGWLSIEGGEYPVTAWSPMPRGATAPEDALCAHAIEEHECRICSRTTSAKDSQS